MFLIIATTTDIGRLKTVALAPASPHRLGGPNRRLRWPGTSRAARSCGQACFSLRSARIRRVFGDAKDGRRFRQRTARFPPRTSPLIVSGGTATTCTIVAETRIKPCLTERYPCSTSEGSEPRWKLGQSLKCTRAEAGALTVPGAMSCGTWTAVTAVTFSRIDTRQCARLPDRQCVRERSFWLIRVSGMSGCSAPTPGSDILGVFGRHRGGFTYVGRGSS